MCIKVPKKQTQRSPKNRTNLYELYVHGKSDQDIEVPFGPIIGTMIMMGYLVMAWQIKIKLKQPSQINSNCEYIAYPPMTTSISEASTSNYGPPYTFFDRR
jgi:hypothetical protein